MTNIFDNQRNIFILLANDFFVTGLGSDSFISVEESEPEYKQYKDIDGKITFTKTASRQATFKLTLKDNSIALDYILEYKKAIDEGKISGMDILVTDKNNPQNKRAVYGSNCKIMFEPLTKGVKLGDKVVIFLPEVYYNETDLLNSSTVVSSTARLSIGFENPNKIKGT